MYYDLLLHVDTDEPSLRTALRNAENYLWALEGTECSVAIVLNGKAVELLLRSSCPCLEAVTALVGKGVGIFVCNNALRERNIEQADIIPGVAFVPAGIVYLVDLQRKGYAYVKP